MGLSYMKPLRLHLPAGHTDAVPRTLVVHGHPAALFLAVVPVLVVLVIERDASAFDDVEDFVVVVIFLIVVGDGLLSHFGILLIEINHEVVDEGIKRADLQADALGFAQHDRIAVAGIGGVQMLADSLSLFDVLEVIGQDFLADFD